MNHIFKVVFNPSLGIFVAVPEFAKSQGKQSSFGIARTSLRLFKLTALSAAFAALGVAIPAWAGNNATGNNATGNNATGNDATGNNATGNFNTVGGAGNSIVGNYNVVSPNGDSVSQSVVIGSSNTVGATAVRGKETYVGTPYSGAATVGGGNDARNNVVIGVNNTINSARNSILLGRGVNVAVGANNALAFGLNTRVNAENGVALGAKAAANAQAGDVALGAQSATQTVASTTTATVGSLVVFQKVC